MLASSEYACGAAENGRYGPVPNPWDRTRWAGGSSTGSGAALAARIVPLALGTDTGGSIRIPAALCGITGFKPTRGLVPRTGVAPLSWTLDHIGPMARSCADIAHVLPVLAGPDGTDTLAAAQIPSLAPRPDITGLRIGVPNGWFTERCDSAVLHAWRAALDIFQQAGAILIPIESPVLALAHEEAWMILYAELAACQDRHLGQMAQFDAGTRDRIARGLLVPAADYARAQRRRPLMMQAMLEAMADVDIMVTPGAGAEAPPLATLTVTVDDATFPMYEVTPRNTMIFDYTGFPALMLPAGLGASGLPVAIQLVAKPFQDALSLSAGMAFQAGTTHHSLHPPSPIT
jgi:aspartyl-tRNA(Asn)/glutamyl-tRNA(Gln) amidotransferase subunit A